LHILPFVVLGTFKNKQKMKVQTTLQSTRIKISEPMVADVYYIEQADDNGRFYITSESRNTP